MAERGKDIELWWGPIRSVDQAREIIAWTAFALLILAAAPAAALLLAGIRHEITVARPFWANADDNWYVLSQGAFMTVVMAAAVMLLKLRSWISGLVLLIACVFVMSILLASIVRVAGGVDVSGGMLATYALLEVCLAFFCHLVWRAMGATQALRQLEMLEHFT